MKHLFLLTVVSVLMSCQSNSTTPGHYELVSFMVKPGVERQQFIDVNERVNKFLIKQPGFISRGLGQLNDSVWVDALTWRSKADYEAAFQKSTSDSAIVAMSTMIRETGAQVWSFEPALHTK